MFPFKASQFPYYMCYTMEIHKTGRLYKISENLCNLWLKMKEEYKDSGNMQFALFGSGFRTKPIQNMFKKQIVEGG